MQLLVPRPSEPSSAKAVKPPHVPTQEEWVARYRTIERLYVQERRRLRFVMSYMESEHGFKAT